MARWMKMVLLTVPLVAGSAAFGIVCRRMGSAYRLLWPPFQPLLHLLLWLGLSIWLLAVAGGLVAVLFRPLSVAVLAFGLSAVAMLAAWGWSWIHLALTLLYVAAGFLFTALTQRDLQQRIRFSVRPAAENWRVVTVALLLLAVGSLYLGFADEVRREGFSLPERPLEDLATGFAEEVVDATPLSRLGAIRAEGVNQVKRVLKDTLERQLRRVERYIPPLTAAVLFVFLLVVLSFLWWVPMLVLALVFPALVTLGLAKQALETIEVRRLVIE